MKSKQLLALVIAVILTMTTAMAFAAESAQTQDPFGKYEPAIEVSLVHPYNDSAFWFPAGDDIHSNIYTRRYEETLGIRLNYLWTCPGSQAEEKISVMMASDKLPDFMPVTTSQFELLYEAGKLADLTDVLAEYASPYTQKYLTGDYACLLDAATKDGKVYGLTCGTTYHDNCRMIWIRADWLEKLNMDTPKTLAELEAVMDAFVHKDPDGNGLDDTYAMAYSNDWGVDGSYYNMFHVYPFQYALDGEDSLQSSMYGPDYREKTRDAILNLKDWYDKGYLSPDFAVYDDAQMQQDLFNDKCGVLFYDLWAAYWPLILHLDINPNADWVPVPIVSCDDEPAKTSNSLYYVNNIMVASKDAEHPEALVKMSNLYHALNNDPETMEFDTYNTDPVDNNQMFFYYPLALYNPSFNYDGYLAIRDAMEKNDPSNLCSAYRMYYDQIQDYLENKSPAGFSPYRTYSADGCFGVQQYYIENKLMQMNEYDGTPTQAMIDYDPVVYKEYTTMLLNVVMGHADISTYDEFIEFYDSTFVPTAGAEMDEWFQNKGCKSLQAEFDNK